MNNFIITGLPRSRTLWLSKLLTNEEFKCIHDATMYCKNLTEVLQLFEIANLGISDSSVSIITETLLNIRSDIKIVVIRRDIKEVINSLDKFGVQCAKSELVKLNEKLDELENSVKVLSVDYLELNNYSTCNEIYRYCLGKSLPLCVWDNLKDNNLSVTYDEFMNNYDQYKNNAVTLYGGLL